MVKRGPWLRPQASEGEAQHGPFCRTGCLSQGNKHLYCGRHGQARAGSEGGERAGFKRIGLEAGPLSQWLFSALAEAGLPVICVETRHMRAVLKAQINKTDRNDAPGMAQMPIREATKNGASRRMTQSAIGLMHRSKKAFIPFSQS